MIPLIFVTLLFLTIGGTIDYWQAAMEHKKKLPKLLENYFLVIWLFIYTGLLPFLLILFASNYNYTIAFIYLAAVSVGSVFWDIAYSLLDTGKMISDQAGYFVLKGRNYGLESHQILWWHVARFTTGVIMIVYLTIYTQA